MRVLFDHQVFDSQVYEGASRYFVELARHLPEHGVEVEFAVRETDNVFLHADPRWSQRIRPHRRKLVLLARLRDLAVRAGLLPYMATFRANQDASEAALKRGEFDIFHPTYYEPYFLPLIGNKLFVVTVHDMIHELFPQYVKPGNPTTEWKKQVLARAAHIIAVSEVTKQDLVRLFAIAPERITVIHHGVGAPFALTREKGGDEGQGEGNQYLLYVGGRDRYKNFSSLLLAFPDVLKSWPKLNLVCVGGGEFTAGEKEKMKELGIAQRVRQQPASDEELAALYRGAAAFVFPSLYEGFGMPILEAFACGCPLVVSNIPAFKEVAGNAALYFDPNQPADLARAINELLTSPDLPANLRSTGLARVKAFIWQRAATETSAIYKRVLARAREKRVC